MAELSPSSRSPLVGVVTPLSGRSWLRLSMGSSGESSTSAVSWLHKGSTGEPAAHSTCLEESSPEVSAGSKRGGGAEAVEFSIRRASVRNWGSEVDGWEARRKYCRGRKHFLLLFVCLRVLSELMGLGLVARESRNVSPVIA